MCSTWREPSDRRGAGAVPAILSPGDPYTLRVGTTGIRARIEEQIRRHRLIEPGGEITCLVSGGADSTCLWHALRALGYRVRAQHLNHKLRGEESEADARFCESVLGAEVVEAPWDGIGNLEARLRELRYAVRAGSLRATGHTASDQVETVLFRLATSGTLGGIRVRRQDGVVRPLLTVWREETEAYCRAERLDFRVDTTNPATSRGLLRSQVVPALRALHPAAERNVLAVLDEDERLPRPVERKLRDLLAAPVGSLRIDLGEGRTAVREYGSIWLERTPVSLGPDPVRWGEWVLEAHTPGLRVRGWRPGDRLLGRSKKVQDVFVDARVPRSEREAWPLVVSGEQVVVIPGIATVSGYENAVQATRTTQAA